MRGGKMFEFVWNGLFVGVYLYAGQVTWTNIALHAVLNGESTSVWQQASSGQVSALCAKGIFLMFWPALMIGSWIAAQTDSSN